MCEVERFDLFLKKLFLETLRRLPPDLLSKLGSLSTEQTHLLLDAASKQYRKLKREKETPGLVEREEGDSEDAMDYELFTKDEVPQEPKDSFPSKPHQKTTSSPSLSQAPKLDSRLPSSFSIDHQDKLHHHQHHNIITTTTTTTTSTNNTLSSIRLHQDSTSNNAQLQQQFQQTNVSDSSKLKNLQSQQQHSPFLSL
jgi:hypothetical protein